MPWGSWLSRGSCWVGGLICLLTWEMGHWKGLGLKSCKYFGSIGWDFLSKNIYGEWKHNPGSCVAGANPHPQSQLDLEGHYGKKTWVAVPSLHG